MLVAGMGAPPRLEAEIAGTGEGEVAGHILIRAALHAELIVGIGRIRGAGQAALGWRRRDPHQLLGVGEGQRAQQERVHHAEDGNVGADAESENQNGDDGKARIAAQRAEGVLQVLQQNVECHESSRFAMFLSCLFDTADADQRQAAGFFGRQSALKIFFDGEVKMRG